MNDSTEEARTERAGTTLKGIAIGVMIAFAALMTLAWAVFLGWVIARLTGLAG